MTGSNLAAANGYSVLPGGLRIQWGVATMLSGGSTAAVVFPLAFDVAGFTPNVNSTPEASIHTGVTPHNWAVISITNTGFTAKVFGGTVPANVIFNWIAIGKSA